MHQEWFFFANSAFFCGSDCAPMKTWHDQELLDFARLARDNGNVTNDRYPPTSKGSIRILSRDEAEQEDRVLWHDKTPAERLAAAERLRQIAYGYDAATARIQAIIEYTQLKRR
jgi:hypothetical protein